MPAFPHSALNFRPQPPWKRILDLACCAGALPILSVATCFFVVLLSITSPGPILFRQERVGHMSRRFVLRKFRTMHPSNSEACHQAHFTSLIHTNAPMHKLDSRGDPRLVPGGRLLRAIGIDELPQIINILRGEMSIVGPRPCIPYEFEQYTARQRERVRCLPGLTGLWQVSGKNRTTFEEMIELDLDYARRQSLWLDLKIILKTPWALYTQCWNNRSSDKPAAAPAKTGGTRMVPPVS